MSKITSWLREEVYICFHPESPPLSWLGLWQRARFYVWVQAIWCWLTSVLLFSDIIYHNMMDTRVEGEFAIGLVIFGLGILLTKILVLRLGVE